MRLFFSFMTAFLATSASASAATVNFPPPAFANSQTIAANDPANRNVWTGIAQSVTAINTNVMFGFYLFGPSSSQALISVYSGDGIFSNPLKQVSIVTPSALPGSSVLTLADFSDIDLNIGQRYTFRLSLLSESLPPPGQYSTPSAAYAGLTNPYTGGRFWFSGASYNQALPAFADRDLAFFMQGTSAPVPEPSTWLMLIIGFGIIGGLTRRRMRFKSALSNPSAA
jgi:PEP-CTERM motif